LSASKLSFIVAYLLAIANRVCRLQSTSLLEPTAPLFGIRANFWVSS